MRHAVIPGRRGSGRSSATASAPIVHTLPGLRAIPSGVPSEGPAAHPRAGLERAVRVGAPATSRDTAPVPTPASRAVSDLTASSGERCGGAASVPSPQVMPMPMPIGSRSQSVAVGLTVRFVFRRRSRTGPVGSCELSGNAVYRVKRYRGLESLALRIAHI